MKLYVVPTNQVQRFWYLAEPLLQKALDKGNGRIYSRTIKTASYTRSATITISNERRCCYVALTVQWINYPNDRVAYITYIGGKNTKQGLSSLNSGSKKMVELQYRGLLNMRV